MSPTKQVPRRDSALKRRERDRAIWREQGIRYDESGRPVAAAAPTFAARVRLLLRG